jgi:hypothetical protein
MDVILLTLAISLVLSLTFIALFVREFSRPRRAGADRDSLLPLEDDLATAPGVAVRGHSHSPVDESTCANRRAGGKCCVSCQHRKDRAAHPATA